MLPSESYTRIERLVARFKALSGQQRKEYNEDNTRKDFVLPLFHALQWDVSNSTEVSAEEKVSRGWVDFAFRIDGVPRLFLETKRISEDLTKPEWIRQAIDYAWTKGVAWALLSDFEGLRVFNAEWREENPARAQFIEFTVDTYLTDFDHLVWLSRPEVAAGTLDREAENVGKKLRKEPVTVHLFDDLRSWRGELFRHLLVWNKQRTSTQIDEAVLRILNRLIFVRTAEDRQVEPLRLLPLLRELEEGHQINRLPQALSRLFRTLDEVYDSDLFAEHFSESLDCEPEPFRILISGLYERPNALIRYNFNAIDADVLGTVYEQYLGEVAATREAMTSETVRRSKRKAQGIFYTPTFVVRHIVNHTLGQRLRDAPYVPHARPRVLDMACGSGSFLIEAFECLDRHVATLRSQEKGHREDFSDLVRRIEILSECIYGVDKDEQAVAVAKLNLSLKALHTRDRLPMLENVRCGDSLISGTSSQLTEAFGQDLASKKAFEWPKEFPKVIEDGGFDIIIGNPPYVRIQTLPKDEVAYFNSHYSTATGNYDLYVLFVERALSLLKPGGLLGFILPNKFMQVDYASGLRRLLSSNAYVDTIIDLKEQQVFEAATTYTCLLFLRKAHNLQFSVIIPQTILPKPTDQVFGATPMFLPADSISEKPWSLASGAADSIIDKLQPPWAIPLIDVPCDIARGSSTGADDVFILRHLEQNTFRARSGRRVELEPDAVLTPLYATDFTRFFFRPQSRDRIIFPYEITRDDYSLMEEGAFRKAFPKAYKYLSGNREKLESRKGFAKWFGFSAPRSLNIHNHANLVVPLLADRGLFAELPRNKSRFCLMASGGFSLSVGHPDVSASYILGLLNSTLLFWYLRRISNVFRGGWITCTKQYFGQLPIRAIDFNNPADAARHESIVSSVHEMQRLYKAHGVAERSLDDARLTLSRQIREAEDALDNSIFLLYDLSPSEVSLVRGSSPAS